MSENKPLDLSGINSQKLEIKRKLGKQAPEPEPEQELRIELTASVPEGFDEQIREVTARLREVNNSLQYRVATEGTFDEQLARAGGVFFDSGSAVSGYYEQVKVRAKLARGLQVSHKFAQIPTYDNYANLQGHLQSLLLDCGDLASGEMIVAMAKKELGDQANSLGGTTLLLELEKLVDDRNFDEERAWNEAALHPVVMMARSCGAVISAMRVGASMSGYQLTERQIARVMRAKKVLDILALRSPLSGPELREKRDKWSHTFVSLRTKQARQTSHLQDRHARLPEESEKLMLTIETATLAYQQHKAWFWGILVESTWREETLTKVRECLAAFGAPVPRLRDEYDGEEVTQVTDRLGERVEQLLVEWERRDQLSATFVSSLAASIDVLERERATCPFGIDACYMRARESERGGTRTPSSGFWHLMSKRGLTVSASARQKLCEFALNADYDRGTTLAVRGLLNASTHRPTQAFDAE